MKSIVILLLGMVLLSMHSFAAVETSMNRIEGSQITTTGSAHLTVFDNKYLTMATNPTGWQSVFTNYKVTNRVRLGINPEVLQTNALSGGVVISIKSWKWDVPTSAFVISTVSQTLSVNYSTTGTNVIDELSTYVAADAYKMEISITAINGGGSFDVNDVYLQAEIEVERYYAFSGSAPSSQTASISNDNKYVNFEWSPMSGAEYYELEWVHINDYASNSFANAIATSQLNFDFYKNSTRVILRTPYYKIPKLFDRGYLVYRVRAIGLTNTTFSARKEGSWTAPENGLISGISLTTQYIIISDEADTKMNWGHQVMYAEDGKRFEGISFADGIGRIHQSVGSNTETGQAIISNVYYDGYGRPTITDLPTPDTDGTLTHRPNFNWAQGNTFYGPEHYDQIYIENSPSCSFETTPFSTGHGAGMYYSPANPDQDGENARIPDAQQYPFARVEYMDDHTGRIRRTTGVGTDFKLGSGRETEFFYGTPSQEELDRLFGSEVGYATHYQKRIIVDANEQAYIEYFDMAGRVVASGLAGTTPNNLDPLDNNTVFTMTQSITEGLNGEVTPISMTYSKTIQLLFEEDYTFNYDLNPETFTDNTCAPGICLDCAYILKIDITEEECGTSHYSDEIHINGTVYDAICNGEGPFAHDVTIHLPQNNYVVTKVLTVDQAAINAYWCTYLENNTCIPTFQEIYNAAYALTDFSACDNVDEFEEEEYSCAAMETVMLHDLSPGGQYATYTVTGSTYSTPSDISILNTGTTYLTGNWKTPVGDYKDALGAIALIEVAFIGPGYFPEIDGSPTTLSTVALPNGHFTIHPEDLLNVSDFIARFEDSWAEALLSYHPEYCYLEYCESNAASHAYDATLSTITTFAQAKLEGYFAPLGDLTFTITSIEDYFKENPPTINAELDPFFVPNTSSVYTSMFNKMDNYIVINSITYSMWEYAIALNTCPDMTDIMDCLRDYKPGCYDDAIWLTFRDLYLEEKASIYAAAESDYIATQSCSALTATIGDVSISGNPFGSAIPRWGFYDDMIGNYPNPGDPLNEVNAQLAIMCETACEAYADQWLSTFANCPGVAALTDPELAALRLDLIALCAYGCGDDGEHPVGATTLPSTITPASFALPSGAGSLTGGAGINDVLALHISGFTESDLCTELLISDPGAYQESLEQHVYLDECGCDLLLTTDLEYNAGNLPSGIVTIEQLLEYNTGLSMEDIDALICKCKKVAGVWTPNYAWSSKQIIEIDNWFEVVPQQLTCNACVKCEDVTTGLATLVTRFGSTISESPNYEPILTNFLNDLFQFDLTYDHYAEFMLQCSATAEAPICQSTPELLSWRDVLNLMAHRGQLTAGSVGAPLDLVAQNVVYKKSELYNYLLATGYYGQVTGSTLQQTFVKNETDLTCSTSLVLPPGATFTFDDIVEFGSVSTKATGCESLEETFKIEVSYYECGELQTAFLTGYTNCFPIQTCYCGGPITLCNESVNDQFEDQTPCYEPLLSQLYQDVTETYNAQIAAARSAFIAAYNLKCASAFETEQYTYTGPFNQYQYTLFYYDQAGNLVKTVAPEGVTPLSSTTDVVASRNTTTGIDYQTAPVLPAHTFKTEYVYNSYDQLITTNNPDQTGATQFWYDRYGRMVASQNPVQADAFKYSYVLYDVQGRPIEVGQIQWKQLPDKFGNGGWSIATLSESAHLKINDWGVAFKNWVYSGQRTEVTYTVYDKPMSTTVALKFATTTQQNLRLRVASVVYFDAVSASTMPLTGYVSASHYSYDIHGNVIETLQDIPALIPVQQDIKSTQYQFELLSGNVKKVEYQKGKRDRMTHEYLYDKLNRLTEVFTSTDQGVTKNREAHYRYFDYGPLSRIEIGQHKVQGNDFTYTINGWLKGMNSTTIDRTRDGGKDGGMGYLANNAEANMWFARDVTGYSMGYFSNDYKSIASTSFEASVGSGNAFSNAIKSLYNGNIAYTTTAIDGFETQASVYNYDQLQRLKSMKVYRSTSLNSLNDWSGSAYTDEYKSTYTYSENGNLKTLERNGTVALGLSMDDFVYNYTAGSNRLSYVTDTPNGASPAYGDDINDGQVANNYQYDKLGQLVLDAQENLTMEWRFGDKKLKLQKNSNRQLEFVYNTFGQRVLKIEKRVSGGVVQPQTAGVPWTYTYYGYDANGQVMATYNVIMNTVSSVNTAALDEQLIYGSGRLGTIQSVASTFVYSNQQSLPTEGPIWINQLGKKNYELTNHLGNVNAVITDRKVVNPSYAVSTFTNSTDGWTNCSNASLATSATQLNVTITGTNNCIYKLFTTVSGQNYTVCVKSSKGSTSGIKVKAFGSSLISTVNLADNEFTTFIFQANSTISSLTIETVSSTSSGNYSVDEVSITPNSIYQAVVIMKSDYYPFGMQMPAKTDPSDPSKTIGGHWNTGNYRFGYNGMEKDPELKGDGNSYTTEFRQYDPRLGRWASLDPLMKMFPSLSPYCAFDNNPIYYTDPYGLSADGPDDPPAGLPTTGTHEQIAKADNGNSYQYVVGDNGKGSWVGYTGEYEVVANKNPMKHVSGNVYNDSPDHDMTKEEIPGFGLNKIDQFGIDNPNDPNDVYKYLEFCYSNSCSAGMDDPFGNLAEEGLTLLHHFVTGGGKQMGLGTDSYASEAASEDSDFIEMAEKFEKEAINHFKKHGNLNQFNGSQILEEEKPYMNDTWYLHTIMGGMAQVTAVINTVSEDDICVTYYLWDHFGGGTNDTQTNLPGLSALYHLQHNFHEGANSKYFTPFVWYIKIER